MMQLNLLTGIAGMLILLIAFILNLLMKLTEDSLTYCLLNVIGGALLATYAYNIRSFPFFVLEIIWAISALYKIVLIYNK
jgi:hypothetical protein